MGRMEEGLNILRHRQLYKRFAASSFLGQTLVKVRSAKFFPTNSEMVVFFHTFHFDFFFLHVHYMRHMLCILCFGLPTHHSSMSCVTFAFILQGFLAFVWSYFAMSLTLHLHLPPLPCWPLFFFRLASYLAFYTFIGFDVPTGKSNEPFGELCIQL